MKVKRISPETEATEDFDALREFNDILQANWLICAIVVSPLSGIFNISGILQV